MSKKSTTITYTTCTFCLKDVTEWLGVKTPEGQCPHCDSTDTFVVNQYVPPTPQERMDAYYPSCKTKAETLGGFADKNTKAIGRNYIEEIEHNKKINRQKGIDDIMAQKGIKAIKKSGKRPFYRKDRDTPISETEAASIMKEFDIKTPKAKAKPRKK